MQQSLAPKENQKIEGNRGEHNHHHQHGEFCSVINLVEEI